MNRPYVWAEKSFSKANYFHWLARLMMLLMPNRCFIEPLIIIINIRLYVGWSIEPQGCAILSMLGEEKFSSLPTKIRFKSQRISFSLASSEDFMFGGNCSIIRGLYYTRIYLYSLDLHLKVAKSLRVKEVKWNETARNETRDAGGICIRKSYRVQGFRSLQIR